MPSGVAEPRLSRRALLKRSVAVAGTALAAGGSSGCALRRPVPARRWESSPGSSGVFFRWFGANAWEIRFAPVTILIDPWFTRFPAGRYEPGGVRPQTPLVSDPAKIDPYIRRVDVILVSRGHYDHIADIPYVAGRTGARVLGTHSHCTTLRAMGVPADQLVPVEGGRRLRYGKFDVDVFAAPGAVGSPVAFPVTREAVPARPRTVADLVAGGTLIYQITVRGQFRILVSTTANVADSALAGQRPDLAIVAAGEDGASVESVGRLMRVLDHPTWAIPTGWDDAERPLTEPAADRGGLAPLRAAIATTSPATSFIKLDHLQVFTP